MLRCVSNYKSSIGSWTQGDMIDNLTVEIALMKDSPNSFVSVENDEVSTVQTVADNDKMIRRGRPPKVVTNE